MAVIVAQRAARAVPAQQLALGRQASARAHNERAAIGAHSRGGASGCRPPLACRGCGVRAVADSVRHVVLCNGDELAQPRFELGHARGEPLLLDLVVARLEL